MQSYLQRQLSAEISNKKLDCGVPSADVGEYEEVLLAFQGCPLTCKMSISNAGWLLFTQVGLF